MSNPESLPISKAAQAQKAEATGEKLTVEFKGETFTPEVQGDSPELFEAQETMESGRVLQALKALLGSAEWKRFKALKPSVADAGRLMRDIQEKLDIDMGELAD